MEKLTKKQQLIAKGNEQWDCDVSKNYENGSVSFSKGMIPYEEFHEAINHLFTNGKITIIHGSSEDFVLIKRKCTIKI